MRAIKFRGKITGTDNKDLDGKWVYGDLSQSDVARKGYFMIWDESRHYFHDYYVEEKTIGQFTGLKDAEGKEIYEGDILFLEDDEVPFGCVSWHPDGYFAIDRHFVKYDFQSSSADHLAKCLTENLTMVRY